MTKITLNQAGTEDAEKLAAISQRAFASDREAGARGSGGPPGYDSASFQLRAMKFTDYYNILLDDTLVGGIIVSSRGKHQRILERIFIDPPFYNQGIASRAMELLWALYPNVQIWTLGTPEWNKRTQHFYEKLGFIQVGWEIGDYDWRGIWYQKLMDPSHPFQLMTIGELKDEMKDVTLEGMILSLSSPREVKSRSTGKPLTVANAELGDSTGKIVLVLWNAQISQVKIDDRVRIEFGHVTTYNGVVQLNLDWNGYLIHLL